MKYLKIISFCYIFLFFNFLIPNILYCQCYGGNAICCDSGNVFIKGDLYLGEDDVPSTTIIHSAGTLIFYDDSDDTLITIGPVEDGSTTLDITGSLSITGQVGAGTLTISSGSITDSSGAISLGNENLSGTGEIDFGAAVSLEIPNNNGDVLADKGGELFYDESEDQFIIYDSQGGELSGEKVADTAIKHFSRSRNVHELYHYEDTDLFIRTIGDDAPSGFIIDEWRLSLNCDPTVEIDADLMYADDWITLNNPVVIDILDTINGVSSEDDDSIINNGAPVPYGKVIYIRINQEPDSDCVQMIFEGWGHAID